MIKSSGSASHCILHCGAQSREGADTDVCQARFPYFNWDKGLGEVFRSGNEDNAHDATKSRLEGDQCICEPHSGAQGTRSFVPDDDPRRPWKAFIEYFGDNSNVSVDIRRDHTRCVDVCDPEFRQSAIQSREQDGKEIE